MPNGQWAGHDRAARLPDDWDTIRADVFATWGHVCHVCGEDGAYDVDHVIAGDNHDPANLRPIHGQYTRQRCHVYKSSSEGGKALWANRPRRQRPAERHPGMRS